MKKLLFVDDEPNVLQGIRRMLRSMRGEWCVVCAGGGKEALALMASDTVDVIVSDMRMPEMDGGQLLTEVKRLYPETVRIILSGQSSEESILRSIGPSHQYLSKPCDPETLKTTIRKACALRDLLSNQSLRALVSRTSCLPSLPSLYVDLLSLLNQSNVSIEAIGELIEQDIGMTANILQLINSAYFGLPRQVSAPSEAAVLLGVETLKALVLLSGVFSQFEGTTLKYFSLDSLQTHSAAVALLARDIACAETQDTHVLEDAFMAGLLHDAGKLLMASSVPERYEEALTSAHDRAVPLWQAEEEVFGTTHAEVGAYLLGLWGLPEPILEAVAYHHNPDACPEATFGALTVVHVANALCGPNFKAKNTATDCTDEIDGATPSRTVSPEYLERIGVHHRLPAWIELAQGLSADAAT